MRGDFSSSWKKEKALNFRGTLHQQGRVMTDRDGNALTEHFNEWQEVAGQDIIGAGVAAVPADAAENFKVINAAITSEGIGLNINAGRVWADGLLINLVADEEDGENNVVRKAIYLRPPIQGPQPANPPNFRDAVILETWCEELNAFQLPDLLIEPALGASGIDTTERVNTAYRFRLYRMKEKDTCDSIIGQLDDDFENKGKLTVTLQPDETVDEDCPVDAEGGYTGFEHQLYRLEVAQTDESEAFIKWSQFNGGLVGRGTVNATTEKINITSNNNAIMNSGLTEFYLEAVKLDEEKGFWRVVFGAKATLNISDQSLEVTAADAFYDSYDIADGDKIFFRLWNGIFPVSDYRSEDELQDGIHLEFNTDGDVIGKYTPHDYWTFEVRAGSIVNNKVELIEGVPTLINELPPEGIYYHRVPLAEVNWKETGNRDFVSGEIEDCRRIFQPLTKLSTCCTYRVGDGVNSHGDFASIQTAINNLPKSGGQICILPGEYKENIHFAKPGNRNIHIKGCGNRTKIVGEKDAPTIHVRGGENLRIESLSVSALNGDKSVGVLLEGEEQTANREEKELGLLRNIALEDLQIISSERSGIEMHVGQFVSIRNCKIYPKDGGGEWAAVYLAGDDLLFEDNEIRVITGKQQKIFDERTNKPMEYVLAETALGGLHISGGCERVRVTNNLIIGGTGNGINLGSVDEERINRDRVRTITHLYHNWFRLKDICHYKPDTIDETDIDDERRIVAGAPIRDILIENNRIFSMGRNGIGVEVFFIPEAADPNDDVFVESIRELISVENLFILGNEIRRCLNRETGEIRGHRAKEMGFGGIALSEVENLVVRDNFITDNGLENFGPICGIFILIGEGIEISRNHILNNGKTTGERTSQITNSLRGGILIRFALAGSTVNEQSSASDSRSKACFPDRLPALTVHNNVVNSPLGRALTLFALGNVSIVGNQFLSQRVVQDFGKMNLFASTVLIFNLSKSMTFGRGPLGFERISRGQVSTDRLKNEINSARSSEKAGLLKTFGNPLLGGSTLFANNQCRIINRGTGNLIAGRGFSEFSSILIVSLADVGFHDNYCVCDLERDIFLTHAFVYGFTTRLSDNFLEENFRSVGLSGITFGILNTTTDNQSTHCLLARGIKYIDYPNLTISDAVIDDDKGYCDRFNGIFNKFGRPGPKAVSDRNEKEK